jgi:hypothetical protein
MSCIFGGPVVGFRMTAKHLYLSLFLVVTFLSGNNQPSLWAQSAPTAFKPSISLTAGGMTSAFQFRDVGNVSDKTGGTGAYVDLNLDHGLGVEAEGRWQRLYEFKGIRRDNYLIGPRVQIRPFWRTRPYLKVLVGVTDMSFGTFGGNGRFGAIAIGGGFDCRLGRQVVVRIFDAEYQRQKWPASLGPHRMPYGVSVGIAYRIF